jgi:hypothetical protein
VSKGAEKALGRHISLVLSAAERLYGVAQGGDFSDDADPCTSLLLACSELQELLDADPSDAPRKDGELWAATGVLRNAALAYRRLGEVEEEQKTTLRTTCLSLLKQGSEHIKAFLSNWTGE